MRVLFICAVIEAEWVYSSVTCPSRAAFMSRGAEGVSRIIAAHTEAAETNTRKFNAFGTFLLVKNGKSRNENCAKF